MRMILNDVTCNPTDNIDAILHKYPAIADILSSKIGTAYKKGTVDSSKKKELQKITGRNVLISTSNQIIVLK